MDNVITLSLKRDGRILSGRAGKQCAMFGSSARLLAGDHEAIEQLFGPSKGRDDQVRWVDRINEVQTPPQGYGIVCIDLDARKVHSHQGYGLVGNIQVGVHRHSLLAWERSGGEPGIFDGDAMVLDAFMAGSLRLDGSAMACASKDRKEAMKELILALDDVEGYDFFRRLFIDPVGWRVAHWDELSQEEGLFEMARALDADGWPMEVELLEGWKSFCEAGSDEGRAGAKSFEGWIQSLREKQVLSGAAPGSPAAVRGGKRV